MTDRVIIIRTKEDVCQFVQNAKWIRLETTHLIVRSTGIQDSSYRMRLLAGLALSVGAEMRLIA